MEAARPIINIHYGAEITLKGGNRSWFENLLIRNIRSVLQNEKIQKKESRLVVELNESSATEKILEDLGKIFGIEFYSLGVQVKPFSTLQDPQCQKGLDPKTNDSADLYRMKPSIEAIEQAVLQMSQSWPRESVAVETKRSDKSFPLTSMEVNKQVGQQLKDAGFPIDLSHPQRTVGIEILRERALVCTDRKNGLGGLPVGSAGKVLLLFSGGIDSPVAAWNMMRRGCRVDYLHIHSLPDSKAIKETKITPLLHQLQAYSPYPIVLHLAPYFEFYKKTMDAASAYELILFRRFILRLANRIAEKEGYLGIVSGDSLGQVASQTLENLGAANAVSKLPVYRPLLTYTKQEIVDLAKKIGTYDASIQPYKDCCSLVAVKHPNTKPKMEKVEQLEKEIGIEEIVEKTMSKVEKVGLN